MNGLQLAALIRKTPGPIYVDAHYATDTMRVQAVKADLISYFKTFGDFPAPFSLETDNAGLRYLSAVRE